MAIIPELKVAEAQRLYDDGYYAQAFAVLEPFGPPIEIEGTAALLLMSRLASNLEAPNLCTSLCYRAYRHDRANADACYYFARVTLERHGPLAAWDKIQLLNDVSARSDSQLAEWYSLTAVTAAVMRDFETAHKWRLRAAELSPDNPWLAIEECVIMELADRYDDALAAAQRALEIRPLYRPGIQAAVRMLKLQGRQDEALETMLTAVNRIESPQVTYELVHTLIEFERYQEAGKFIDLYERQAVLIEPALLKHITSARSTVAYHLGEYENALRLARETSHPFYTAIADAIETAPADARRVTLPVTFVRQHHMTCAPASLTALARYWAITVDHADVANEICYDGTPDYKERNWAERNGWIAREFTVTWDVAQELIDYGVPFTLVTVAVQSAHLQVVMGYDSRCQTLLIRDPFHFYTGEMPIASLLTSQAPYGPRGMVMLPAGEGRRIEGMKLPDAGLYDLWHSLKMALQSHDRSAAWAAFEEMQSKEPDNALTLRARQSIAAYDADLTEQLRGVEATLQMFPYEPNSQLARLSLLDALGRTADYRTALIEACEAKPNSSKKRTRASEDEDVEDVDEAEAGTIFIQPYLWRDYAELLREDARRHEQALNLLRRALRRNPTSPTVLHSMAAIEWDNRRFERAETLYRFAACLEDKSEHYARDYFMAARHLGHTAEALHSLEDRFERFGNRSSLPARTLFDALETLGKLPEAYAVLSRALERRPDDGMLRLFAAESRADVGEFDAAKQLINDARALTTETARIRSSARIATLERDRARAIALWNTLLESQPLAIDAHRSLSRLLAEETGVSSVLEHLETYAERFPHHIPLHVLWAQWLRDTGDSRKQETAVSWIIALNPNDAWARRELTHVFTHTRQFEKAWEQCRISAELDPYSPQHFTIEADLLAAEAKWEESKEALRQSLRLDVDNPYAINRLLEIGSGAEDNRASIAFIQSQFEQQTITGEGLVTFQKAAAGVVDNQELLTNLEAALAARPDLWQTWSCVSGQMVSMGKGVAAMSLAGEATSRFPLQPQLWLDLADAATAAGDYEVEQTALKKALEIRPGWTAPMRRLFASYDRQGNFAAARNILEQAISRSPLEAGIHGMLADFLWDMGEKQAAFDRLKTALGLEWEYEWAWDSILSWAENLDRGDEAQELIQMHLDNNPGSAYLHIVQAHAFEGSLDKQMEALKKALEINPQEFHAYDYQAELLTEAERYDEALAACDARGAAEVPTSLKGRAAWVLAQRKEYENAVQRMKVVLDADPRYFWGWKQVADWTAELGHHQECRDAARAMIALKPSDSAGYISLGEAELELGNQVEGKLAFNRAIELSPRNPYAIYTLVDTHLDDFHKSKQEGPYHGKGNPFELTRAQTVLETYGDALANGGWRESLGIRLAAIRGDEAKAIELLVALADVQNCGSALSKTIPHLRDGGFASAAEGALRSIVTRQDLDPSVAENWVELAASLLVPALPAMIPALPSPGAVAGGVAYIKILAKNADVVRLGEFIRPSSDWLKSDIDLWAVTGYALAETGQHREAAHWMADWESRDDVEPWMLSNHVEALRRMSAHKEAARVSRHALTIDADRCTIHHEIWLALDAGLAGDADACASVVEKVDRKLDREYTFLLYILKAFGAFAGEKSTDRGAAFKRAKECVDKAASALPGYKADPLFAEVWTATVTAIAQRVNTPLAHMWRLQRR